MSASGDVERDPASDRADAERVRNHALERLEKLRDEALATIEGSLRCEDDRQLRLAAARDVLDRLGVRVETPAALQRSAALEHTLPTRAQAALAVSVPIARPALWGVALSTAALAIVLALGLLVSNGGGAREPSPSGAGQRQAHDAHAAAPPHVDAPGPVLAPSPIETALAPAVVQAPPAVAPPSSIEQPKRAAAAQSQPALDANSGLMPARVRIARRTPVNASAAEPRPRAAEALASSAPRTPSRNQGRLGISMDETEF